MSWGGLVFWLALLALALHVCPCTKCLPWILLTSSTVGDIHKPLQLVLNPSRIWPLCDHTLHCTRGMQCKSWSLKPWDPKGTCFGEGREDGGHRQIIRLYALAEHSVLSLDFQRPRIQQHIPAKTLDDP